MCFILMFFLISSLWIFVSHKCCNCASKIHPLGFDKYSCFLPKFINSSLFPRNPREVLMLTRLNLKVILIVFYNSSNKSESKRSFSLSYYFNFIHVKTEFAKRINNCFENTLVLLRLRREGFPNFLLML